MSNRGFSYVSPAKAWWTVFVLFLAYVFSYIDRTIISLLVPQLKQDLGLSDSQIGLLSGIAFAVFYATMAVPIARLSDARSRRVVIAGGIAVWSLATAFCGIASRFWTLFLARMGVGVGEAVLGPATVSLVADIFPKEKRGVAIAVFGTAMQVGGGLAYALGGATIAMVIAWGPLWEGLHAWQAVFFVVGLPGLFVALLALTIPEPREQQKEKPVAGTLRELFDFMRANRFILFCQFMAFSLLGTVGMAVQAWGPAYFMRHHHLSVLDTGLMMGLPLLIMSPFSNMAGGWLIDYWQKKGRDEAPILGGLIGLTLAWVAAAAIPQMPTPLGSSIMFGVSLLGGGIPWVGAQVALQAITPGKLRAQVAAIYFFVVTVVSIAGGASIVALFTDFLFHDPGRVGDSISLTVILVGPVATALLLAMLRPFRELARKNST